MLAAAARGLGLARTAVLAAAARGLGLAQTAVLAAAAPAKVLGASAVLAAALVAAWWGRSKECREVRLVALAMSAVSWEAVEMAAAVMEVVA